MSERGIFALDRGWFDHPLFAKEPFTEREAWAWLIAGAAFKDCERRVGNYIVPLKRGQIAGSIRFLAERWQWHRCRVERFLGKLKNRDMIETASETGVLTITLCNYDKYQLRPRGPETVGGEEPRRSRDSSETNKNKGIREEIKDTVGADAPTGGSPQDPTEAQRDLFRRGKEVLGNSAGGLIANLLRSKGNNPALARAAIELASQAEDPREYIGRVLHPRKDRKDGHDRWAAALDGLDERNYQGVTLEASYRVLS